jgi:alpha-galactosidase
MKRYFLPALVCCLAAGAAHAQKFEGLAMTPPMGWNSWNTFGCEIDEALIRETAERMVSSGMKDAGYVYVNIDDCWHGQRDAQGFIHPDPVRFPSGMKALADYVHSLGLKIGIYSDAGTATCAGRPGSQGYEYQDAMQYANWGIDYLKYDWCNTGTRNAPEAYTTMRDALHAAGRPVVFSICEWGDNQPWTWAQPIGHLWRTTGDITNCWDCIVDHGIWKSWGILQILDRQDGLRVHAGPDAWNDPDMMEVGNLASVSQDRAHFSMWAMLAAPLIAGNDLRSMTLETVEILTNREVIAVNQDPLGVQGFAYHRQDGVEVWFKPLRGGDWAVAVLNRTETPRPVNFNWSDYAIHDGHSQLGIDFKTSTYRLRDLWAGAERGTTAQPLSAEVPGHDVLMFRLSRVSN